MEPIGGQASGVNVPHPSFASGARTICDRHGIRLVFDESVSALRTGHFLAAHHAPDALPDVAVLAKGLAAGYAPLGAALMPAQLVEELAAEAPTPTCAERSTARLRPPTAHLPQT